MEKTGCTCGASTTLAIKGLSDDDDFFFFFYVPTPHLSVCVCVSVCNSECACLYVCVCVRCAWMRVFCMYVCMKVDTIYNYILFQLRYIIFACTLQVNVRRQWSAVRMYVGCIMIHKFYFLP